MTKRAQWRVRTVLWAVFTTAVLCSISFNKDFLLSERTYYDQNEDELKPQKDQPRPDGRDDSSLTAFMEAMARTATTLATTTTTKEKTTTITTLAFGNLTYPSHPTSRLLPKRLVSVFGLESSGTTFFTSLLARIANVTERDIFEGMRFNKTSSSWEFQHLSLPWGSSCNGTLKVVPVMYPAPCIHMNVTYSDDLKPHSEGWTALACETALNKRTVGRSSRFSGWKETKLSAYFNLHVRCCCLGWFTVQLRASGLSVVTVLDGGGPVLGKSLCVGSHPSEGWVVLVNPVLALVGTSWLSAAGVSSLTLGAYELGARRKPTLPRFPEWDSPAL